MWFRFHFSAFFLPIPRLFSQFVCRYLQLSFFFIPFRIVSLHLLEASLSSLRFICYGQLSFFFSLLLIGLDCGVSFLAFFPLAASVA